MTKSDQIVHSFCIYEIKRHTYKPYDFRWTKFYETNLDFLQVYPGIQLDIAEDELIICSTVIDADNYSLLTTQRLITKENGIVDFGSLAGATESKTPNTIKFEKYGYVSATIKLENEKVFKYFIEAGKAWMVMEYGIRTLIWSQQLTGSQMVNLMRIWDKRSKS